MTTLREFLPIPYWRRKPPPSIDIAKCVEDAITMMDHGEIRRAQTCLLKVFNHSEVVAITMGLTQLMERVRPIETVIPGDGKL